MRGGFAADGSVLQAASAPNKNKSGRRSVFSASYIEIYNEKVFDLLEPPRPKDPKHDPRDGEEGRQSHRVRGSAASARRSS